MDNTYSGQVSQSSEPSPAPNRCIEEMLEDSKRRSDEANRAYEASQAKIQTDLRTTWQWEQEKAQRGW